VRIPLRETAGTLAGSVTVRGATQAVQALVGQAIKSLTNFLTSVMVGRACSQAGFGYYSLGATILPLCYSLQAGLIGRPYVVFSPRLGPRARATYTGSTLVHTLIAALTASVIVLALSAVLAVREEAAELAGVLRTVGCVLTFLMFRHMARRMLGAQLQMGRAALLDGTVMLVQLSALYWLWRRGGITPQGAFWAMGSASAVAVAVWLHGMRGQLNFRAFHCRSHFLRNWRFARWLILGNLVFAVGHHIHPWLLTWFHGPDSAGVLQACTSIAYLANPFVYGMAAFLGPKSAHNLAKHGRESLRRTVAIGSILLGGALVGFFLVMAVAGGRLVTLVYTDRYAGQTGVVAALALYQLANGVTIPLSHGLLALERSDVIFRSFVLSVMVTVVGSPLLTFYLGPLGAGISLVLSSAAMFAFRAVHFWRLSAGDRGLADSDLPSSET
jgi:O-antigen/teichoic acid export membrane protein